MMKRLPAVVASALFGSVLPTFLIAQNDAHNRNECRLAAQILQTGHPAPHRDWAWAIIPGCGDTAGAALAAVWNTPPEGELSSLWGASYRVRDARVTRAVLAALRDRSRSPQTRIVAARVLASHASPKLIVLDSDLAALRPDSVRSVYLSVDHSTVREGTVRVTPELVAEVQATLRNVGENDPDPEVRSAAEAIARQVSRHLRVNAS